MAYAHQGIELKNPYGIDGLPATPPSAAAKPSADVVAQQRPATLSRRSVDAIAGVADLIRAAEDRRAGLMRPVTLASDAKPRTGVGMQ